MDRLPHQVSSKILESQQTPVQERLRWGLPVLVVALLLTVTLVLISLSSSHEAEQTKEQLITDTLWVKQTIQYQLDRGVETLQLLAHDIDIDTLPPNLVELRLEAFMRNSKEAIAVAYLNEEASTITAVARNGGEITQVPALPYLSDLALIRAAIKQSHSIGHPRFSEPYQVADGAAMNAYVPVAGGRSLIVIFSFSRILDENVPWWFAQGNEISLSGLKENVSARRVASGSGRSVYLHQTEIELPGTSLLLNSNSLKGTPDWVPNLLRASIVILTAMVLMSLWALWRDVRRRIQAEKQLYEEAAFRKAMGDSVVTGLRARDLVGRITYVNPAFCAMVGYSEKELIGSLPPMAYWAPEYREEYERRMAEVLAGTISKHAFETVFQRRDGSRFPVEIYEAPLVDGKGQQTGWMSSIVDVSEQKEAQEKIRIQQEHLENSARLNTLGEIASSLAHELNQPLSAITSYLTGTLNMIGHGATSPEEIYGVLDKANQQALRAGQIIRRVHDFVRKREPQRVGLALGLLVEDCLPLIELQARPLGIRISTKIATDVPLLLADPVLLQQVLLNLTRNGMEAMADIDPMQRVLEISVSVVTTGTITGSILLCVRDFGTGITEDVREKLFSAFFTTKPEGMGIGLSISRNIVESHGGSISVETMDPGVMFCIKFPL